MRSLDEVPRAADGRSLAVGTFDGVHMGHRRVIDSALRWGHANEVAVAVVTFDPHPLQVLRPDEPPRLLTSTAVKGDLIAGLGVDELIVIPFTEELSMLDAESFCARRARRYARGSPRQRGGQLPLRPRRDRATRRCSRRSRSSRPRWCR